jgi:hypothetical protein
MTTYSDLTSDMSEYLYWYQREMREMESDFCEADFDDIAAPAGLVDCPFDEAELALEKAENVVASLDNLNSMLCQTLRDKVHSYPAARAYSAAAYEATLKKVEALEVSVMDLAPYQWHELGVGPKTGEFISDWMEKLIRDCDEAYLVLTDCGPAYTDARAQIKIHEETRTMKQAKHNAMKQAKHTAKHTKGKEVWSLTDTILADPANKAQLAAMPREMTWAWAYNKAAEEVAKTLL